MENNLETVTKSKSEASSTETNADYMQVVCFNLEEEEYAFDILNIKEVIHLDTITPVPQMPDFVLGVINIRGTIVPVFDLKKKFKLNDKEFSSDTRIIVTILETCMIGLVVDRVLENILIGNENIDPVPAVKMQIDKECVLGIGKLSGRMVTILNITKVHETILDEIKSYQGL